MTLIIAGMNIWFKSTQRIGNIADPFLYEGKLVPMTRGLATMDGKAVFADFSRIRTDESDLTIVRGADFVIIVSAKGWTYDNNSKFEILGNNKAYYETPGKKHDLVSGSIEFLSDYHFLITGQDSESERVNLEVNLFLIGTGPAPTSPPSSM